MKDASTLPAALETVLSEHPTRRAVRRVVDRCHQMACAYLRHQKQTGALREDLLGENVEDLAMDAIAELFERDDEGHFPELRRYFDNRSVDPVDPAAVEDVLRRLVLSTVTDWLFEAYETADRSLSNVIRNVKRVLTPRENVRLHRRGSTLWLEIDAEKETEAPPARGRGRRMPMDTLEAYLTGAVAENTATRELVDVAVETLRDHPDYEAAYPLTRLAQVMRAARVRVQAVTEHSGPVSVPDAPLLRTEEIQTAIEQSLEALREEKRSTYLDTEKVDEQTFTAYFRALYDRLEARFVPPGDETLTHYEALSTHLPALSKEAYREDHRSRFEYLDQCARQVLVERLRDVV